MQYNYVLKHISALRYIQLSEKGGIIRGSCLTLKDEEYIECTYLMLYLIYLINKSNAYLMLL